MTYLPVDVLIDQKTKQLHRIESLNILAYVSLLVLVLITTWLIKRRAKKSYLHETGLAIIYGLIVGAALRYFGLEVKISSIELEDKLPRSAPADYILIDAHNLGDKNMTEMHVYAYQFLSEILPETKLGTQISYASVNPEVLFNIILPPIVLNAGLSLKRRHFFRNIGAIFSYAFIGTTISVATVGSLLYGSIQLLKHKFDQSYLADHFTLSNCFYFGAIISPTDPLAVLAIFQELGVDVNLFALVFGESILNDAVSIVLTHSIDHFSVIYGRDPHYSIWNIICQCLFNFTEMFLASCLIGVQFGVITAITTKFTKLTESPLLESSLVVLMSYSSFLVAEVFDYSGIVAILMCGITQAHYTINNLSFEARERLKTLFEMLTFLCENFLFLAVGVCFWQRQGQTWSYTFVGLAFAATLIARILSVYPLSFMLNLGRKQKIPANYLHLITWAGTARGVISYSLAARNTMGEARRIMLSTTSAIVIVTVIVVGASVNHILKFLKIPYGDSNDSGGDKADGQASAVSKKVVTINSNFNNNISSYNLNEEDDDLSEVGQLYHATHNPSWMVRPKRIGNVYGWSICGHHHNQRANESLLIVNGDSLSATTPHVCRFLASNGDCRRHRGPRNRHQHRNPICEIESAEATPVLEIESASTKNDTNQRVYLDVANRRGLCCCRCCCCGSDRQCMIDSRSARSTHSSSNDHHRDAAQLMATPRAGPLALHQPLRVTQEQQTDTINAIESRTESTLALAAANGLEIANASSETMTTINRSVDGSNRDVAGPYENASFVRTWRNIDNYFIKPLLTNSHPTLMETMPASLKAFAKLFTSDEQLMRSRIEY